MIDDIITPDDIDTPDESTEFTIRVVDAGVTAPTVTAEATVTTPDVDVRCSHHPSGEFVLSFSSHEYFGCDYPSMLTDVFGDTDKLLHVDGIQSDVDSFPEHSWFEPNEVLVSGKFAVGDARCHVDVELVDAMSTGAFDRAFDVDVHPDSLDAAITDPDGSMADVWKRAVQTPELPRTGITTRHDHHHRIACGDEIVHITGSDDDTEFFSGEVDGFAYYPAEDVSSAEDAAPDGVFDPVETSFDYEAEFTFESVDGFEIDEESIEDDVEDDLRDAVEYAIREGVVSTHDEKFDATGTAEDDDTADGEADDATGDDDAVSFSDSLSD